MKFDIADFHIKVIFYGHLYHIEPVELMQEGFTAFERVLWGNHKPYSFQIGIFRHSVGNNQVPDMNRIEGTEKQPDFHRLNNYCPVFDKIIDKILCFSQRCVKVFINQRNIEFTFEGHFKLGFE